MFGNIWYTTDESRLRVTWFGLIVAERKQFRKVWAHQPGTPYSPNDWRHEERWVRADRGTLIYA